MKNPPTIFIERDGNYYLSGKFAFWFYQQYGTPPDILLDVVNEYMEENNGKNTVR